MRSFEMDDKWLTALDADSPEWLLTLQRESIDAYRTGDINWLLENTHPEIEIVQPAEFVDGRTYRGLDGLIEALLDWPREWEDFRLEPKRIFALDDTRAVVDAIHRGRSRTMGVEVEAQIVWLLTFEEGRTRRWDMFMNVDDALNAAESSQ